MRALLVQADPVPGDRDANAASVDRVLRAHPGAQVAVFPELFLDGYRPSRAADSATDVEAVHDRLGPSAARAGTALVVGFAERTRDGGIANAVALIDGAGRLAGRYRKAQLFGPDERAAFVAGDAHLVVDVDGARVAPLVCFDVEFPEPARACARAGARLLVTVAANMAPYAVEHRIAVRARAIENRIPHLYVNRAGAEDGHAFVGGTCAVDAYGTVLAQADDGDRDGPAPEHVVVCDVPDDVPVPADLDPLLLLRPGLPVHHAPLTQGQQ